jgi:hypothetical protein
MLSSLQRDDPLQTPPPRKHQKTAVRDAAVSLSSSDEIKLKTPHAVEKGQRDIPSLSASVELTSSSDDESFEPRQVRRQGLQASLVRSRAEVSDAFSNKGLLFAHLCIRPRTQHMSKILQTTPSPYPPNPRWLTLSSLHLSPYLSSLFVQSVLCLVLTRNLPPSHANVLLPVPTSRIQTKMPATVKGLKVRIRHQSKQKPCPLLIMINNR